MKKVVVSLSLFAILNSTIVAETTTKKIIDNDFKVTLSWLDDKPTSYAKDFFIIQYLKQKNITEKDAKYVYEMARNKNGRVKKAYNKIVPPVAPEDLKCYRYSVEQLFKEDDRCLALGVNLKEASTLKKSQLEKVINRVSAYPTLLNDLKYISSNTIKKDLLNTKPHRFYRLFFDTHKDFRIKTFNTNFPKEFIFKLSEDKKFNRFIRFVIADDNYKILHSSLINIDTTRQMNHQTLFSLAMNALRYNSETQAVKFLNESNKKAYSKMDKDKILFWKYLISKKKSYLEELSLSTDNNIYSLYAKELLNIKIQNIYFDVESLNKTSSYDITNQFEWIKVLKDTSNGVDYIKLEKYKNIFSSKDTLPHYTYVLEKYNKYKKQFFITPYKEHLKNYDINDRVLIYSIARQESKFIPSAISFATAQGIMQIMPFLSRSIAKEYNEDYNVYHQFIPSVNIKYSKRHLDVLKKRFDNNPLFIAYAYNGGEGYTKGQFRRGRFKDLSKKYEPFLSMELISYGETRKYGKKVLANYYIYNNYLNKKNSIKLSSIFQTLVAPSFD